MACMEHVCTECPWSICDNVASHVECPKCGGDVHSFFDEEMDHDEE